MTPEQAKALRADFPAHLISKLPKPMLKREEMDKIPKGECKICGAYHAINKVMHLDYVGHAAITDRLLSVDPEWNWEPVSVDDKGFPVLDGNSGMWIRLTVCGVTRLGYGDAEGKTGPNAMKERIGDALRNAAMRFGVALDLWSKVELHPDGLEDMDGGGEPKTEQALGSATPEPASPAPGVVNGWTIEAQELFTDLEEKIYLAFKEAGRLDKHADEAEKWRKRRANDPAETVLTAMAKFVDKLKKAAQEKAAQSPSGPTAA